MPFTLTKTILVFKQFHVELDSSLFAAKLLSPLTAACSDKECLLLRRATRDGNSDLKSILINKGNENSHYNWPEQHSHPEEKGIKYGYFSKNYTTPYFLKYSQSKSFTVNHNLCISEIIRTSKLRGWAVSSKINTLRKLSVAKVYENLLHKLIAQRTADRSRQILQ